MRRLFRGLAAAFLCVAAPLGATGASDSGAVSATAPGFEAISPEVAAALAAKAAGRPVEAGHWMVAAANPHAVAAGARVLREGGSAVDAMVAVQAVLGLVEPQSSGLGGGAFLVWYDAATGAVTTLDGRETAPLAATPKLFQTEHGVPMDFFDAVVGGRSVGVPGTPALMRLAHEKWGKSDWRGLFSEAIALAEGGFVVSPRLARSIAWDADRLARHPATGAYFLPGGAPLAAGAVLKNRAYADVLKEMAADGVDTFYTGDVAKDIVAAVRRSPTGAGALAMADLAIYRVKERPAVCVAYRLHEVCGMGPSSSGGLTVGQILGMLAHYDISDPGAADTWRLIGDASRLAFADRDRYMADSDFVPVPVAGLIDPAYLARRAALLQGGDALSGVEPGRPAWDYAGHLADPVDVSLPSTSHISIVDADGNALSMTTTIEYIFGSRVMVRGFLLNNELTDFSFRSHRDGVPVVNRVEPGKRPRSSMAPTIVLRDGKPVLVVGSPGGSRIIGYVAQAVIAHLDWDRDVQQAVSMPLAVNRYGPYELEAGTAMEGMKTALASLGYPVEVRRLDSGLYAISIGPGGLRGGADPRREGIALGD